MSSSRALEILLLALLLLGLASGCSAYHKVALGSLEIGDHVRVPDFRGAQYAFEVAGLAGGRVAGDRIEIDAGQIAAVHRKRLSLTPIVRGVGKVLFGAFYLLYLVGSSIPIWAIAL